MSSTEHVLIPKVRYQQLLQRMTEKSVTNPAPNTEDTQTEMVKRIKPIKIENERETSGADLTEKENDNNGAESEYSDIKKNQKLQDNVATPGKRSYEEIINNHSAKVSFLPPGERPESDRDSEDNAEAVSENVKNPKILNSKRRDTEKKTNKDVKVNKRNKKSRKKVKPYSSLSKKWLSL